MTGDSTVSETYEPSREWGRRHPWRMTLWWLTEAAVRTSLGLQDSIEHTNRAIWSNEAAAPR